MNTDIRLGVSFRNHRKRKKLERILGPGAAGYLIDLWIGAAVARPDGRLAGWDQEDMALEAGWPGEPRELVDALVQAGFVDVDGDCFVLHDWADHNPWAAGAEKRSAAARKANAVRWAKQKGSGPDVDRSPKNSGADPIRSGPESGADKKAYAPSPPPSPPPNPNQKQGTAQERTPGGPPSGAGPFFKALVRVHRLAREMQAMPGARNGKKAFNAHVAVATWVRRGMHPEAMERVLEGVCQRWDTIGAPWNYANQAMEVENGKFNARDHERAAGGLKAFLAGPVPPELAALRKGVLKDAPRP